MLLTPIKLVFSPIYCKLSLCIGKVILMDDSNLILDRKLDRSSSTLKQFTLPFLHTKLQTLWQAQRATIRGTQLYKSQCAKKGEGF